jgi:hypothetical protein
MVPVAAGTWRRSRYCCAAFLRDAATVVIPSRSEETLDRLVKLLVDVESDHLIKLVELVGDVKDPEELECARETLASPAKLCAVVAALGVGEGQVLGTCHS